MFNLLRLMVFGGLILGFGLSSGCGTKAPEEIQLNLTTGDNAFNSSGLVDLVFQVQESGSSDIVVFPAACAPDLQANCGFTSDDTTLSLGLDGFTIGASITVEVNGRDDTGNTIICGSKTFKNQMSSSPVAIIVSQGVCS